MQQSSVRFHFLDGLRGIAAMLIVVHHTVTENVASWLTSHGMKSLAKLLTGFTQSGVELFFVLSGVVLLHSYFRRNRKLEWGKYYYQRFKRIYPPYFGALIFGALVIIVVHLHPTFYSELLMHFTIKDFIRQIAIFDFGGPYFNVAWWSLQIEILFYLIVPFVIYIMRKNSSMSKAALWRLISVSMIIMTVLQLYMHKNYPFKYSIYGSTNLYKSIDYPVCFILGIYIAGKDVGLKEATRFLLLGILLIFSAFMYPPLEFSGYGFLYAGIISVIFNKQNFRNILSQPLFIWLGERSYSLFLVHFSVLYLVNYTVSHFTSGRTMVYGIITRSLGIPMSIFGAMLLFHFVERKFAKGLITANMFWPWQVSSMKEENSYNPQPGIVNT